MVVLILNNVCYIVNLGDSRAIVSKNGCKNVVQLTQDHKPDYISERERIYQNGGYIYKSKTNAPETNNINMPYRVFPGTLSVK